MFICYRFQTCCNIKIYIYCNFGGSYYIFLFEDYLFNSFRQHLFHGKRKGVYFSYLFFDYNALYMYMFPFFNNAKRPRGVPFQILLRVMLFGALTSRDSYNCFCRWSWLGWWDFKIIGAAPISFLIGYTREKLLQYVNCVRKKRILNSKTLTDFLAQRCELYNGFAAELNSIWNDIQWFFFFCLKN